MQLVNMNFSSIYKLYSIFDSIFQCVFLFCFLETSFIFCSCYYLLCRRGKNHFDFHIRRIGSVPSAVESWKRRGLCKKKWTEGCLFPAAVVIFSFILNLIKKLFPSCTLIWRVNNDVSRQGKV